MIHKMIKRLTLVIFFIFFSFTNSNARETRAYYHDVPDNIQILFPKQSFKKWLTYIEQLRINKSHITEEYKKTFKIKGLYKLNDKIHKFAGKARITGDWTDHINFKENYSSLSISLSKGNVGGITKFRLLIPYTRGDYNEIFWSTLINELGFYSPHRQMIKVSLQNRDIKMILEEKPEKEFLESRGFRETPSIEFDERQNWENEKFKSSISENLVQLKIKNRNFLKNKTAYKIAIKSLYYPNLRKNFRYHQIYNQINTPEATHGIDEQNSKFVYDAIYNTHYPIYFDGDVNFNNSNCDGFDNSKIPREFEIKIDLLEAKYNKFSLGKKLTDKMKCVAIKKMEIAKNSEEKDKIILPVENFQMDQEKKLERMNTFKKKNPITSINENFDINYCKFSIEKNMWENCENILFSQENIKNILSGDDNPEYFKNYKLYPIHNFTYKKEKIENFHFINLESENYQINVEKNETKFIKANLNNAEIIIKLKDSSSKIVFYDSLINNSLITTNIKKKKNFKNLSIISRYDERLLTGCITFIDTSLKNSQILVNNCESEDSVNFIRSEGFGNTINIKNAKFDGVDMDFSRLYFDKVKVENSGNDCVDVSGGVYNIDLLIGSQCDDKGLSVGEKSIVAINNINISNSKGAFALKDSSNLHISKGQFRKNKICGEIYQKKQEFGLSKLFIDPNIDCKIENYNSSILDNLNICKYVNRNFFFSTCINKNGKVFFYFKNIFPKNSILKIKYFSNDMTDEKSINIEDISNNICKDKFVGCIISSNLSNNLIQDNIYKLQIKLNHKNFGNYLTDNYYVKL